ncbi:MAG: DOMON-like domain-containing protein [Rhodocyclaceae bacterium]|nr:DOMON-like domain-containing protein [Rhodocyclaceae bacterium]
MPERTLHADNDFPLMCHRRMPTHAIERLTARAERGADGWLRFRYTVCGAVDRIALPASAATRQTDELWRHTCFEAFITAQDGPAYVECNFSPSGAWATYRFARYRTRMTPLVPSEPPRITLQTHAAGLILEAELQLSDFSAGPIRIGLTAVIEDKAGDPSYWALHHPCTQPDFHHRSGFTLRLA